MDWLEHDWGHLCDICHPFKLGLLLPVQALLQSPACSTAAAPALALHGLPRPPEPDEDEGAWVLLPSLHDRHA